MSSICSMAIPTAVAEAVRATLKAPIYEFPAHPELATDDAPCRHRLRTFTVGKDRKILFTYDSRASKSSRNRDRFTFTPIPVPAMTKTQDSLKNCAGVHAQSRPTRAAGV